MTQNSVQGLSAGPKKAALLDPINLDKLPIKRDWRRVEAFFEKFLAIPKGRGAGKSFTLLPFQRKIIKALFPISGKRPRQALTAIARGNGKSTLAAAVALYCLFADNEDSPQVLNIGVDLRQAHIVFDAAVRMIRLNPELDARCKIYQDKVLVPYSNGSMFVLPADEGALQGYDPSFAVCDELAYVPPEVWESVVGASGKREQSLVWAISTPPLNNDDSSVMWSLVQMAKSDPDPSFSYTEFSSDPSHALDCLHCWRAASPALGKFLMLDGMRSAQRTMRETSFRRLRLGQFVGSAESAFLTPELWRLTEDSERPLIASERLVVALDGSFSQDSTVLVGCTVDNGHHLVRLGLWEAPPDRPDWRVPVEDVEQAVRELCRTFEVIEITADPYRWTRSLQILAGEGLPVSEFPQSGARMTPATTSLSEAFTNETVTHPADDKMREHFLNAVMREDYRGTRVQKDSKMSNRRIDLCVASLMAHARATWYHAQPIKKGRAFAW